MSLEKHKILRVNCPGYGHQSNFSTGCAEPLYEYGAIIVNPISILHLFDKDPDLLKQVEEAQLDGMSSYVAKSDKLIESLTPELESRMEEMVKFLEQGGLLIYYLCRPFNVQGPSVSMDNYSWLEVLAPDKPNDKNERHMASVSHGKNIEATQDGQGSPFARYLRQAGLEWTTLIRSENLTDDYIPLANAGPNKIVSAYLNAGSQGGTVVFLPAPYQQDYDDSLVNCLELWVTRKGLPAAKPVAAASQAQAAPGREPPPRAETSQAPPPPQAKAPPPPEVKPAEPPKPPEAQAKPAEPPKPAPPQASQTQSSQPQSSPPLKPPEGQAKPAGNHQHQHQPEQKPAAGSPLPGAGQEVVPKAKDLIEKMEGISKTPVPDWCQKYSFADLDKMREELGELNETVRRTKEKIEKVEGRIRTMEGLKNALLAAEGDELHQACSKIFEQLGWKVKPSPSMKGEFWLMDGDSTAAIVRVVRTPSKPKSADVAQLAEAIISYWGEHEEEPKGVLLASTYANRPPAERTEEDYSDAIAEFAQKKNLCLMTCVQLLSIYRDAEGGATAGKELRDRILNTSGCLPGFSLESRVTATAN